MFSRRNKEISDLTGSYEKYKIKKRKKEKERGKKEKETEKVQNSPCKGEKVQNSSPFSL